VAQAVQVLCRESKTFVGESWVIANRQAKLLNFDNQALVSQPQSHDTATCSKYRPVPWE
jgi:hypothetical protein